MVVNELHRVPINKGSLDHSIAVLGNSRMQAMGVDLRAMGIVLTDPEPPDPKTH